MKTQTLTLAALALTVWGTAPLAAFELPTLWFPAPASTTLSTQGAPTAPVLPPATK